MKDEAYYREKLAASNVPEHCRDGLVLYLLHGIQPGDFLTAVLSNDLREACGRADETNRRALYDYVFFLYNYAPGNAWGSEKTVRNYILHNRQKRAEVTS